MNIEQPEKPKTELDFFAEELNLSPEKMEEMKNFADNLKNMINSSFPMVEDKEKKLTEEEKKDRRRCLDECNNYIKETLEIQKDDDEIKILIPLKASREIVSIIRNCLAKILCSRESEEKKYDISLVIDEALANAFTHCKKGSEYAAFSIKEKDGHITEITTMNFSEEEIPEEMLSFLNKPKEETKEILENFSNNDVEKINNDDFDLEKDIEGAYKKRGLEVIAQLIKDIKYEKNEAGELGFVNKFTFEI
ncbi:MAG: hypothetical protein PHI88_03595 [Candidatus Pacebacteria bacterium]|nr:hypothetical protein [Candidatus Paceibacterota bacterium]